FSLFPRGLEPRFLRDLVQGKRRARPASREWLELLRRVENLTAEDAARSIRIFVGKLAAGVMGRSAEPALDPDTGFFEMGMDSMMAVEFAGQLRAALGDTHYLPVSFLFNHPTVRKVADYLA